MLSYEELRKKYKKDEEEEKTYGPSKATTGTKKTAGPSAPKTAKTAEKSAVSSVSGGKNIPNTNLFQGLNVSKPEKKKLSGSDSDVLQRAKSLAANTTMSYAEKKKQIESMQKELGKVRDRNLLGSLMQNADAKKTISQVTDLQNQLSQQLKRTAFGAGFGQAAGLDIYDSIAKRAVQNNPAATAQMQKQEEARKAVQARHPGAYTGGQVAGELTQQAILYGTAGAAAEKAALAKLAGGKELTKAGAFGAKVLANQAADTAVMTPLTIAAGLAEGKEGKDIAVDVAKQQAMDIGFNLVMGAAGEGLKALKGARAAAKHEKEARAAVRSAERVAEANASRNQISFNRELIKQENLPNELLQEYRNLTDPEWVNEHIKANYYDEDAISAAIKKLDDRRVDLEEMLGIKTRKETDTEKRIYSAALKEMKGTLSIFGQENTAEAKKLLQKALTEARTGKISKGTREEIFDALFAMGGKLNRDEINKDLRDRLKNLNLVIAKEDASNVTKFEVSTKGTFGKFRSLRIAKEGELGNVDDIYQRLAHEYASVDPELFPADITNPGEQLERMKEVADAQVLKEIKNTDPKSGADRDMMRGEFEEHMDKLEESMYQLAKFSNSRAEKQIRKLALEGVPMDFNQLTPADVKWMYDERWRLDNEAQRLRRTRILTDGDKDTLNRLLKGEIDEATARRNAGINANDLMDIFRAEQPLHKVKQAISDYKKFTRSQIHQDIDDILGEVKIRGIDSTKKEDSWKDANGILLGRETPERVIDMVAPKKVAAKIKKYIFEAFHENERKRTIYINDFKGKLRDIHISTKKNMTLKLADGTEIPMSESGLVQWLGEKEFELKKLMNLKTVPTKQQYDQMNTLQMEIDAAMKIINPAQEKRIRTAIEKLQKIYKDEVHETLNNELIRRGMEPIGYIEGYFPHMNFDDPTDPLGQFAQKFGWDFTAKELPMDIAGRTEAFRPNKRWSGNLLERKGTETDYDALRGFDLYIDNISDIIYHTEDILKMRTLEDSLRYKLSDEGVRARVDAIRNDPDMPEFEKTEKIQAEYDKVQNPTLQNFVTWLRTYTDLQAGKKHSADRQWEKVFGRKFYKISREIENRVASNMVVGNIGSAMTNFIPITQGMANMSLKSNLQGLKEALEYMAKGSADELTEKSAFLTTREGTDLLYETGLRKISNAAAMPMTLADKFSTQAVWRSRYYDNLKKGMAEDAAIRNADQYARSLFGGRSKGAMPTAFQAQNPLYKAVTMFQLEVNNQLSYLLKDIPKEHHGNALKLFQTYSGILVGAYVFNDVYEKLTGRRSALDPIGMANDYIGSLNGEKLRNTVDIASDALTGNGLQLTEETEVKKDSAAFDELLTEAGGNVPFVGGLIFDGGRIPIQSAIPNLREAGKTFADLADGEVSKEKAVEDLYEDLSPALWYGLMPTAGGQMRKTLHGLNTMNQGGRYNATNEGKELQFAVDQENPKDWLQAALFGNWATEGGKAYLESGNKKALSAKRTEVQLEAQEKYGISPKDYVALFKEVDSKETRRSQLNALRKAGLSEEAEEFFYQKNILSSDKQQEEYTSLRSQGMTYREISDLQTKIRTMEDKYAGMLETTGYGPTKAEKKATEMYEYIDGLSISDELKAQLQDEYADSAIQKEEKYQKVKGILSVEDYAVLNDYLGTIKGNGKRYSKAWKLKAAIDRNVKGKSQAEMHKLYDAFGVSPKVW